MRICACHSDSKLAKLLGVSSMFVNTVRRDLKESSDDYESAAPTKPHSCGSGTHREPEFTTGIKKMVKDSPGKSTRAIARVGWSPGLLKLPEEGRISDNKTLRRAKRPENHRNDCLTISAITLALMWP